MVLRQPASSFGNNIVGSLPKALYWNKFQMEKIIKCKKEKTIKMLEENRKMFYNLQVKKCLLRMNTKPWMQKKKKRKDVY